MRSKIGGLAMALSSAAFVVAGGCGGSPGGTGTAGHGGSGGQSGDTAGAAGSATAGTSGGAGTVGAAGASAGMGGATAGSSGGAGAAAPFPTITIPDGLAVPTGATLKFRAHGIGTQNYACVATTAAAADAGTDASVTTYAWGPATPNAKLYDETNTQIGTHFAGPTWMSSADGSDAVGSKVASVASPLSTAIPWLLLKAVEHMGSGVFMDVSYVQRLATANGVAPATGCDSTTVNTTASVAYTADYYFYTGGVTASDGGVAANWPFAGVTIPDALATP